MTQEIYVLAAISAALALCLAYIIWNAPEGYEDAAGFHLGKERDQ